MNTNKICPDCGAEYYPYVMKCADCGADLMLFEEYRQAEEEKKRLMEKAVQNMAVVREGDIGWLSELRAVLIDNGIASAVREAEGCKKGCCGSTHWLVVQQGDLAKAREAIEEYFLEINPELRAADELIKQGRCPACSSSVAPDQKECPDCGLPLLIEEEE